jgi:hypothetical protein
MLLALGLAGITTATPQSQQPPDASPARDHSPHPAASTLWVNTSSGYYHKPDSRHHGKTEHSKYMTEPDTVRAGYRPARN